MKICLLQPIKVYKHRKIMPSWPYLKKKFLSKTVETISFHNRTNWSQHGSNIIYVDFFLSKIAKNNPRIILILKIRESSVGSRVGWMQTMQNKIQGQFKDLKKSRTWKNDLCILENPYQMPGELENEFLSFDGVWLEFKYFYFQ